MQIKNSFATNILTIKILLCWLNSIEALLDSHVFSASQKCIFVFFNSCYKELCRFNVNSASKKIGKHTLSFFIYNTTSHCYFWVLNCVLSFSKFVSILLISLKISGKSKSLKYLTFCVDNIHSVPLSFNCSKSGTSLTHSFYETWLSYNFHATFTCVLCCWKALLKRNISLMALYQRKSSL